MYEFVYVELKACMPVLKLSACRKEPDLLLTNCLGNNVEQTNMMYYLVMTTSPLLVPLKQWTNETYVQELWQGRFTQL